MKDDTTVRVVLSAGVAFYPANIEAPDWEPKTVDLAISERAMARLVALADVLQSSALSDVEAIEVCIDSTKTNSPLTPPPSFRGGDSSYTGAGRADPSDPLWGSEESSKGACLRLSRDASGKVQFQVLALPYDGREIGLVHSEPESLDGLRELHAAAVAARLPIAFSLFGLEASTTWELLDEGFGEALTYGVYSEQIRALGFKNVSDAAFHLLDAAAAQRPSGHTDPAPSGALG